MTGWQTAMRTNVKNDISVLQLHPMPQVAVLLKDLLIQEM